MFDGPILVVEPPVETLPEGLQSGGSCDLVELQQALDEADVVVLLTDHGSFLEIAPSTLEGKRVLDSRGVWPQS